MTRNRWTGLAGLLFTILFLSFIFTNPQTPDQASADAAAKYASYWNNSDHQTMARVGMILATYACLLLVAFTAGLRDRLRTVDSGLLPSYVLAAGTAAAALVAVGVAMWSAVPIAAADSSSFKVDGSLALALDAAGYGVIATGLMLAASVAVVTGIVSRRTRVLPAWTAWLGFLLGLTAAGSLFTAWIGLLGLPLWTLAVSIVLLTRPVDEPAPAAT